MTKCNRFCSKMFLTLIFCWCLTECLTLALGVPLQKERHLQLRHRNEARIVGGQVAYAGQFPFLGALNTRTSDGAYFCGAALLTRQWAVTAGHCLDGTILLTLQFGSHSLNDNDPNIVKLTTDTYVLHPLYDRVTLGNDIGVIEFRMPITYTDYIRAVNLLPSVVLSDNSPLLTMGWGQVNDEDGNLQNNVNWVSVTTIPNLECRTYYGNQILDTMACAEGNYNEGTCYGDTGGPLIQYVSRAQVMLVGIASFISQNGCESTDPSGYTRIFDYAGWIRDTTDFV